MARKNITKDLYRIPSGHDMQNYLNSKALNPSQLNAELASHRKDFDASGKWKMPAIDWNTPERQAQRYEQQVVNRFMLENTPPEEEDERIPLSIRREMYQNRRQASYNYLFPKFDYEKIRSNSLQALSNSPTGQMNLQETSKAPKNPKAATNPFAFTQPKSFRQKPKLNLWNVTETKDGTNPYDIFNFGQYFRPKKTQQQDGQFTQNTTKRLKKSASPKKKTKGKYDI